MKYYKAIESNCMVCVNNGVIVACNDNGKPQICSSEDCCLRGNTFHKKSVTWQVETWQEITKEEYFLEVL